MSAHYPAINHHIPLIFKEIQKGNPVLLRHSLLCIERKP